MKHLINSEPLQISTMELFAKIVENVHLKPLTVLAKRSILNARLGPKCASASGYS